MSRRRRTLRATRSGSQVICGRESCKAVLAIVEDGIGIRLGPEWARRSTDLTWVSTGSVPNPSPYPLLLRLPVQYTLLLRLPVRIECRCGAEQSLDPTTLEVPASLIPIIGDSLEKEGIPREATSVAVVEVVARR